MKHIQDWAVDTLGVDRECCLDDLPRVRVMHATITEDEFMRVYK